MPKEVTDIKTFLRITQRKDAIKVIIKKRKALPGRRPLTKFKVRCSRYIYTLRVEDPDKAEKLTQSLPPGLAVQEIDKVTKKKK